MGLVHCTIHGLKQARLNLVLLSILDRLKKQVFQGAFFKKFAKDVINATTKCLTSGFKLLQ